MSARYHVVGGGIAGLAAAWELSASEDVHVTVHEASDRWGGKVHTSPFAGRPVDDGADAFLLGVPWALDLARELGLEAEIVHPA
ncbi:MAG: FAD-dependent oxidoreductase, partial [Acidimicrobiales bacterium]